MSVAGQKGGALIPGMSLDVDIDEVLVRRSKGPGYSFTDGAQVRHALLCTFSFCTSWPARVM